MSSLQSNPRWKAFREHARRPNAATLGLARAVEEVRLEPSLVDLVDLLSSYVNACHFYPAYVSHAARRGEIDVGKLEALATWRDRDTFSEKERAALAWAEALAQAMRHALASTAFEEVRTHFDVEQAAFLSAAIAAMGIWNRADMAFQYAPLRMADRV